MLVVKLQRIQMYLQHDDIVIKLSICKKVRNRSRYIISKEHIFIGVRTKAVN